METAVLFLLCWPFAIGGAVEATKALARPLPERIKAGADAWLPALAFLYGAASGALLHPLWTNAVVYVVLELDDQAAQAILGQPDYIMAWAWALAGLGAGGVAATVYRAVKQRIPDKARETLDWWK